jgi:spore maturation protein CgeB
MKLRIVILGLSISSSWGNGHATVYRGLVRELVRRGHDVLFLERDKPWYAQNRDLPPPLSEEVCFYQSLEDLKRRFSQRVGGADAVIVGSYVPEGAEVCRWATQAGSSVTAFYDIDTPVTLAKLEAGECEYLEPELIPRFSLYLSFTGGAVLELLRLKYGSPMARAFYCCVDPSLYYPETGTRKVFDLGHLGTYSDDRRTPLENLLLSPARMLPEAKFVVAGPMYPQSIRWPSNVRRIEHVPPFEHRAFYNAQRFTLNITRAAMVQAGYSPSVRLFEAAACGTPILSDRWPGLEEFFEPGAEIFTASSAEEVREILARTKPSEAMWVAAQARLRVLKEHTAARRASQLEQMILQQKWGQVQPALQKGMVSRSIQ